MPFIKLKRNWFGPNGVRYKARNGLIQVSDEVAAAAPSDAEIFDDNGKSLPSPALKPLPGFGAKPLHEQVLDTVPGAAPLHQIKTAYSGVTDQVPVSEAKQASIDADTEERKKIAAEAAKTPEHQEAQKSIDEALEVTPILEENIEKATDPVATAARENEGGGSETKSVVDTKPEPPKPAAPKPVLPVTPATKK
jgi:hypothetical protein